MGGLNDLIPDDADTSGRSSSRSKSTSSGPEYVKEFGSKLGTKKFTEERWKEIKQEIRRKTEYSVGEVESLPAEERHEVLHELGISSNVDLDPKELEHGSDTLCVVCGNDCSDSYVPIQGNPVCINHPAIQIAKALDIEPQGKVNED